MTDSWSDSPFAEFAAPKLSAVEQLRSRRQWQRRASREHRLFLGISAAAVSLAAAGGASVSAGVQVLPVALWLAVAGSLVGMVVGWLVGATTWAAGRSRALIPNAMQEELFLSNSWDKLAIWLSVWETMGLAAGAAFGAGEGATALALAPHSFTPWVWGGALFGSIAGFAVFQIIRRTRRRSFDAKMRLRQLAEANPDSSSGDDVPAVTEPPKEMRSRTIAIGLTVLLSAITISALWFWWARLENRLRQTAAANACYTRGVARANDGDLDGAIAEFTKAINLAPDFHKAYLDRGLAREWNGDLDGAISDYTAVIELKPNFVSIGDTYGNRGDSRYRKGDLDGAIADYTKALEHDPSPQIYNSRGHARAAQGDLDGAIADCSKAIWYSNTFAEAYMNRGLALLCQGKNAEAHADFEKCLNWQPQLKPELEEQLRIVKVERDKK